ncbi:hypothetical protein ACS0TY_023913 [Phlomoides rotata]
MGNFSTPIPSPHDIPIIPQTTAIPHAPMQVRATASPPTVGVRSYTDIIRPTKPRLPNTPIPESMKPMKIMMSRCDKPHSTFELGKKLNNIWNLRGNLNLIPHSKGYYTTRFSSLEDCDCVFRRRHWVLQPGAIRLQHWVQDFNSNKVYTSLAQVWVRLTDLPMEYLHPGILNAIASALGTLIKIDD